MGILNVTPDSFSDGGLYLDPQAAVNRALQMIEEGADILDIGAESTRPYALPVDPQEEWRRLRPVLLAIRGQCPIPISIDTQHAEIATEALVCGAEIINDVSCARDSELLQVVSQAGAGYVLMHSRGNPQTMSEHALYDDLMLELREELSQALSRIEAVGIARAQVCLDPGFGFAKNAAQNWHLFENLSPLLDFKLPLLIGISRKKMLAELVGRQAETLAGAGALAALWATSQGANIIRTHDVGLVKQVLSAYGSV